MPIRKIFWASNAVRPSCRSSVKPHEIQPRHFPGASGWAHVDVRPLDRQRLVFCRDAEFFDKADSLYGRDDGEWAGRCFCRGNLRRLGPGSSGDIASGQSRPKGYPVLARRLAVCDSSHRGASPVNNSSASAAVQRCQLWVNAVLWAPTNQRPWRGS